MRPTRNVIFWLTGWKNLAWILLIVSSCTLAMGGKEGIALSRRFEIVPAVLDQTGRATLRLDAKRGLAMVQDLATDNCYLFEKEAISSLNLAESYPQSADFKILISSDDPEILHKRMIEVHDPVTAEMCVNGQSYWIEKSEFTPVSTMGDGEIAKRVVMACLGGMVQVCSTSPIGDVKQAYKDLHKAIDRSGGFNVINGEASGLIGDVFAPEIEGIINDIGDAFNAIAGELGRVF